jgi:hypothetical protein
MGPVGLLVLPSFPAVLLKGGMVTGFCLMWTISPLLLRWAGLRPRKILEMPRGSWTAFYPVMTRHPHKGVRGNWSQRLQHLGLLMDTRRGMFGLPAMELEPILSMECQVLARARRNRRMVPGEKLESFVGKDQSLRLAVPETAFGLRILYSCVPVRGSVLWSAFGLIGKHYRARLAKRLWHPALNYI